MLNGNIDVVTYFPDEDIVSLDWFEEEEYLGYVYTTGYYMYISETKAITVVAE